MKFVSGLVFRFLIEDLGFQVRDLAYACARDLEAPENVAACVCQCLALLLGDDGSQLLLVLADERLVPEANCYSFSLWQQQLQRYALRQ